MVIERHFSFSFPELGGLEGGCFWKLGVINSAVQFCVFCFFIHNFLRGRFVCLVGEEITVKEPNGRD